MSLKFSLFPVVTASETADLLLLSRVDGSSPSGRSNYTITVDDIMAANEETRLDDAGAGVSYIGKAAPGALDNAAVWKIIRLTETGADLDTKFADGTAAYSKVWDSRASYTY